MKLNHTRQSPFLLSEMPLSQSSPTVKKVLAVVYSQTGQLLSIADSILQPLRDDHSIRVHVETLRPRQPYPFPWPFFRFLDTFPESIHLLPDELEPLTIADDEEFDLVIIFYQVWFLAPSRPVVAFLHHPRAQDLLEGKPVVTVVACRNMWMNAHRRMTELLQKRGAHLTDNVVLTDKAPTLVTLLTTPLWLLTGRKRPIHGLPPAGVPTPEIARSVRFGRALRDALKSDLELHRTPMLLGLKAVEAQPELLVSERAGARSFCLWGKLLRMAGPPGAWQRLPLLGLYLLFLIVIIITVVPVSLAVQALLRPSLKPRLGAIKQAFEQPSGSGDERMTKYDF